jgi:hypothetical protein
MVDAEERDSDETQPPEKGNRVKSSDDSAIPKTAKMKKTSTKQRASARNGQRESALMAKPDTNVQFTGNKFEDELKHIMERCAVLIAKDFSDLERAKPRPIAALQGAAKRDIGELIEQIHRCCSDKKWTNYQKRVACEQLVELAFTSTHSVFRLAKEFPEPFREIAEELPWFPCLFPAHADHLRSLQKTMWNELNLGKRHPLKLRSPSGRKTFSTKTWVNKLLIDLIQLVHELAREEGERDPGEKYGSTFRDVAYRVPLTPQNAKEWLDVMWKVLLAAIPNPETHPRLCQLGGRPNKTFNVRSAIKEKLGTYLKRMLNDQTVHR